MRVATKNLFCFSIALFSLWLVSYPAMAHGGLEKVNAFVASLLLILKGISIGVVTIAIMWAGYKFLFKQADIAECGRILAGGLFIGGAAEFAAYLLV